MTSGVFGDDIASTVLNSVTCFGNETELLDCSYSTSGTCSEHNAAVICQGRQFSEYMWQWIFSPLLCTLCMMYFFR